MSGYANYLRSVTERIFVTDLYGKTDIDTFLGAADWVDHLEAENAELKREMNAWQSLDGTNSKKLRKALMELETKNARLQQDNELLNSLLKALGDEAVAEYRRLYEAGELTGPDNQSEVRG